jgi:general secretion pathway protein K
MSEPAATREHGFALLIVLWALGLLALLVSGLVAAGRSDLSIAGNTCDSAIVEVAADGAVQQAVFQLMSGTWTADGAPHRLAIGRATVLVQIEDQRGKFNPNLSTLPVLAASLGAIGTDPETALDLAREMVDWRTGAPASIAGGAKLDRYRFAGLPYGPANSPFASLDEIGLIPGMTPGESLENIRRCLEGWRGGNRGPILPLYGGP